MESKEPKENKLKEAVRNSCEIRVQKSDKSKELQVSMLLEIVLNGSQGKHILKSTAKTMCEGKENANRKVRNHWKAWKVRKLENSGEVKKA